MDALDNDIYIIIFIEFHNHPFYRHSYNLLIFKANNKMVKKRGKYKKYLLDSAIEIPVSTRNNHKRQRKALENIDSNQIHSNSVLIDQNTNLNDIIEPTNSNLLESVNIVNDCNDNLNDFFDQTNVELLEPDSEDWLII